MEKNKRTKIIGISFIYLILILLMAQLVFYRGINDIKPVYLINIGIDFVGMAMGYTLYICCLIDLQKTGTNIKYLSGLINVAFIQLFTDGCAWLVDAIPSLRVLNLLDNTLYYLCAPVEAYFFWMYTMTYLKVRKSLVKQLSYIVIAGLYVAIAVRILNLFTGWYFTVSPDGIYARSPYNSLNLVYSFFTCIAALVAVVVERKQLERYQIVTFFMYALAPMAVGVLTTMVYGLSLGPMVIMMVILLMYCVLNVSEGQDKAIADRDLQVASAIQENVLPKSFPFLPERKEFDLYASMTPAKEVGGDFYDFYMIDDRHLAMVMADVSGKGIPAALFMMIARIMIKNALFTGASPEEALYDVNNQLCEGNTMGLFVTVWLGVIDIETGEGLSVNAGHEHPVIKHAGGEYELIKYKHSPAVATMDDIPFKQHSFKMEVGDSLFVYTDGVPEANNSENELLGSDRMLEILNRKPDATPQEVIENMMDGINEFVDGANQFDDITMLSMTYHGSTAYSS